MTTSRIYQVINDFKPGDLVLVDSNEMGVVLSYYDSNVYESASAEVLVDGKIGFYKIRQLSPAIPPCKEKPREDA